LNISKPLANTLAIALVFALAIAVVNGFGRFAYALLLPVMRQDLQWDYALSGWLNTANSIGYGVGGLLGAMLSSRIKPVTLFTVGLISTTVTLLLCGYTTSLSMMLVWRFITGVGSAWVFACGGAIVSAIYQTDPAKSSAAIAVYYAGGGLGIAMSGLILFPVLDAAVTWQSGWLILGSFAAAMMVWPIVLANQARDSTQPNSRLKNTSIVDWSSIQLWHRYQRFIVAYFLFGVGYIVYLTFVIAWLKTMQLSTNLSISLWVVMGLAAIASGRIWRYAISTWHPNRTFAATTMSTCVGSVLPLFSTSLPSLFASVLLVGGSFFMVPGSVMALIRSTLPSSLWSKAMSLSTMIFAIGQAIGPVAAGWVADSLSLNMAMFAGAVTLLISAGLAFTSPRHR
jgi:predicted MFS family arabinose efflux permease